jgi:hypothetical protein
VESPPFLNRDLNQVASAVCCVQGVDWVPGVRPMEERPFLERPSLPSQIGHTSFAALKLIPGLSEVLSFVEELNKIWIQDPQKYQQQVEYEAALFKNIAAMIEQSSAALEERLVMRIREVDKRFGELSLATRLNQPINTVIVRHTVSQILNYGLTSATPRFSDLLFAARMLSDMEFKILVSLYGREFAFARSDWAFSVEEYTEVAFPGSHAREISFSLSRLHDFGFLERIEPRGPWDPWESRSYRPAFSDIDDFGESTNALPVTAILPMIFSGIDAEKKVDTARVDHVRKTFQEMSKETLRMLTGISTSAIRRHPFEGYQWNVVKSKPQGGALVFQPTGWQGRSWEYPSSADAMNAARVILEEDRQPPDWITVAV